MDGSIDLTLDNTFRVQKSVDKRGDIGLFDIKQSIAYMLAVQRTSIESPHLYYDKDGNYLCDKCGDSIIFNFDDRTLCDRCDSELEFQMKDDLIILNK